MVNYQLRKLGKYHRKNQCIYDWYLIHKEKWIERKLNLKAVTVIYPVKGWFKITQYNDKIAISIADLVETT